MADKEARVSVHVQPNASKNRIVGFREGILYVRIAAPAVEGRANQELVKFLGSLLGVRKSSVSVQSGTTGRNKLISVRGVSLEAIDKMVEEATEGEKG